MNWALAFALAAGFAAITGMCWSVAWLEAKKHLQVQKAICAMHLDALTIAARRESFGRVVRSQATPPRPAAGSKPQLVCTDTPGGDAA